MLDEHKPVEDAAAAEDVALVVAARRHDMMMIAKISPLLPLLPPPRRVFYAVVSTIYISNFFVGIKYWTRKNWRRFFGGHFSYMELCANAHIAYYTQTRSSVWCCSWDSRAAGERYHASPRRSKNKS